jgi:Lon protease-like protein
MASDTTTLPLFPLSLVLFPGMALPLHIFEERYKRMINLCIREGRDFGVVLAGASTATPGQPLTYPVGTTAHITGATRLPDGCMNLITAGERRFRIRALDWDLEYCMAEVEWIIEPASEADALRRSAERRWDAFRRQIAGLTNEEYTGSDLSTDPTEASYSLAASLPVNNTEKQLLLEATDTAARLREIIRLIGREHGVLRFLTEPHAEAIQPPEDSMIYPN